MHTLDLAGHRFGRLTVMERVPGHERTIWLTHCDCGKSVEVLAEYMRAGKTRSCGCLRREVSATRAASRRKRDKAYYRAYYKRWKAAHRVERNRKDAEERRNNPARKIMDSLRCRIRNAVKGISKSATTAKLLGCPIDSFLIYLESRFEPGMCWENYGHGVGKWQIDHIMPCAIFDLTRADHQRRCFHFSNLQPMWAVDNARKGARIVT